MMVRALRYELRICIEADRAFMLVKGARYNGNGNIELYGIVSEGRFMGSSNRQFLKLCYFQIHI